MATLLFRAGGVNVFAHFPQSQHAPPISRLVGIRLPAPFDTSKTVINGEILNFLIWNDCTFGQESLYHWNLALSRRSVQTECYATPPAHPRISSRPHSSLSNYRDSDRAPRYVSRERWRDYSTTHGFTREPCIWLGRCWSDQNLASHPDE